MFVGMLIMSPTFFFVADTDHTHQVSVCALYVLYNVENEDGDGLIHVNDHNIQMVKSDV